MISNQYMDLCQKKGYKLDSLIGEGTYGSVYQAEHVKSGKQVAIKHIKLSINLKRHMRAVEREIDLLYKFGKMNENKYTTQLLDAFYPDEAEEDCQ